MAKLIREMPNNFLVDCLYMLDFPERSCIFQQDTSHRLGQHSPNNSLAHNAIHKEYCMSNLDLLLMGRHKTCKSQLSPHSYMVEDTSLRSKSVLNILCTRSPGWGMHNTHYCIEKGNTCSYLLYRKYPCKEDTLPICLVDYWLEWLGMIGTL